jgi:hypothetical protein
VPLAVLLVAVGGLPASASTLRGQFSRSVQPLAEEFGQSVARALPLLAASPGASLTLDMTSGIPTVERSITGQLYLERPEPIGRSAWNVSLSYQRVHFDTIDGKDIGDLRDTLQPVCGHTHCNHVPFTIPHLGVDLDTHEVAGSVTYGPTERSELTLTVPLLITSFDLDGRVHNLETRGNQALAFTSTKVGVGDVFVRGKYRPGLLQQLLDPRDAVTFGLVLRVPSGNPDNFQGTGSAVVSPQLYLSTKRWNRFGPVRAVPYVNAALDIDTDTLARTEGRYGIGVDVHLWWDRFTAGVAFLGRHQLERTLSPDAFQRTRCLETRLALCEEPEGRTTTAPLFGVRPGRNDYYDLSLGLRANVWGARLIAFANVIVPLNRDGLRADFIPLAGIEMPFGEEWGQPM